MSSVPTICCLRSETTGQRKSDTLQSCVQHLEQTNWRTALSREHIMALYERATNSCLFEEENGLKNGMLSPRAKQNEISSTIQAIKMLKIMVSVHPVPEAYSLS